MAPRFGYINPNIAFNPQISFQVVIMAFLGGMQRLWGPLLGVIPLIILSELLQVQFPYWFSILLGLIFMAIVYSGLKDKDQAFRWLEKAYEEREGNLVYLNVEPRFDAIRSDPRFHELVRRVGLPQ